MTPTEFFEKNGIVPTQFEGGLLAVPTDKLVPMSLVMRLYHVPRCGPEYQGAFLTCFCDNERELMVALTTASLVSTQIEREHNIAGHL